VFGDQTVAATPIPATPNTARDALLNPERSDSPVPHLDINPPDISRTKSQSPPPHRNGGVSGLFKGLFKGKSEEEGGNYRRLDDGDDV
jgi:hypothetical protein